MTVDIKEVTSKADQKRFVDILFDIYVNNEYWVPPLKTGEIKILQPQNNPAFEFCDAKFWLAYKDGKCVGRIGAIINHLHNEKMGEKMGRFSRLEFIDDHEVVTSLIGTAENWIKSKGMNGIHGPLGFSNLDTQGLLVEGFDHLPCIGSTYSQPYYQHHLDELGFKKEVDWIEFRLFPGTEIPEKVLKINEIVKQRNGFNIKHFTSKSEMKPYAMEIFKILNEVFVELHFVIPLNDKMIDYYSKKYFDFLNPSLVKMVENKEGKIMGFVIGIPSLSEAMQKAKGRLFPFGFLHIIKAMKKPEVIDLMLTGIRQEAQNSGAAAILMTEMHKEFIKLGVNAIDTTGMFETNVKAIQNWKSYNHIQHKRKRCYRKMFDL